MKTTVSSFCLPEKREYPYLGISSQSCIVLFVAPNKGTVLVKGNTLLEVGEYSTNLTERIFKVFEGSVNLSN